MPFVKGKFLAYGFLLGTAGVKILSSKDAKKVYTSVTAACLEEHFPHSIANAVIDKAKEKGLFHSKELHTKINYIVAHGIASTVNEKRTIIGSYHFVFEDEKSTINPEKQELFDNLPDEYSHLYLAIDEKNSFKLSIYYVI